MLILRLLGFLTVLAVGAGIVAYLATGKRSYLRFSAQVFKYALLFALLIVALLVLERVVLIPA